MTSSFFKYNLIDLFIIFFLFSIIYFDGTVIFYLSSLIVTTSIIIYLFFYRTFRFYYFDIIVIIFILFNLILISLGLSINEGISLNRLFIYSLNFIIFRLIYTYLFILRRNKIEIFKSTLIFLALTFSIFIFIYDFETVLLGNRLGVALPYPFGFNNIYNPNISSVYFAIATVFLLEKYLTKIRFNFNFLIVITIISWFLLIILFMGTRKGLILISFAIFSFFFVKSKSFFIIKLSQSVFIFYLIYFYILISIPFVYNLIGSRIESIVDGFFSGEFSESSAISRSLMIQFGWERFLESPIYGFGLDTFTLISPWDTYSHSTYIELLVGNGLVGTLIYYSLLLLIYLNLAIRKKYDHYYLFFSLILIIIDLIDVTYLGRDTLFFIFFLAFMSISKSEN